MSSKSNGESQISDIEGDLLGQGNLEADVSDKKESFPGKEVLPSNVAANSTPENYKDGTLIKNDSESSLHLGEAILNSSMNYIHDGKDSSDSMNNILQFTQVTGTSSAESSKDTNNHNLLNTSSDIGTRLEESDNMSTMTQVAKQDSSIDMPNAKLNSSTDNVSQKKRTLERFSISKVNDAAQAKSTHQGSSTHQVGKVEVEAPQMAPLNTCQEHVPTYQPGTVKTEIHKDGQRSPEIYAVVSCEKDEIKLVRAESKNLGDEEADSNTLCDVKAEGGAQSDETISTSVPSISSSASLAEVSGSKPAVKGRFKVKSSSVSDPKADLSDTKTGILSESKTSAVLENKMPVAGGNKMSAVGDSKVSASGDGRATTAADNKVAANIASKTATPVATAVDQKMVREETRKISDPKRPVSRMNSWEYPQGARAQQQTASDGENAKQTSSEMNMLKEKSFSKAGELQEAGWINEYSEVALQSKAQGNDRSYHGPPIFRLGSSGDTDENATWSVTSAESPRKCLSPTGEYPQYGPFELDDPRSVPFSEANFYSYPTYGYNEKSVPPDLISDTSSTTSSCMESPPATPNLTPSSSIENLLSIYATKATRSVQIGNQAGEKAHPERTLSASSVSTYLFRCFALSCCIKEMSVQCWPCI